VKGNGDDEKDDASAERTVDDKRGGASPRRADDQPEAVEESGLEAVEPRPEDEVEARRREAADLRDQLLRKRAEFENFKRRIEREREQIGQEKAAQVLKALIPPIDNLERALAAATEADESAQRTVDNERGGAPPRRADDPLKQGVGMILRELMGVLESSGVTIEDPVGQPFDPLRHQALATEPAPGQAEGTVLEVFRKGYVLKDRLLRPALVKVAQGAGDPEGASRGEKVH
jgi:molecular chaperone GrpE